jgi:hypothetical protein
MLITLYIFQIHLLGFPPHTTHILQPLDVGIFGPIKSKFHSLCVTAGMCNTKATLNKLRFPVVWKNAISQAATKAVVSAAFRRSGLYPFDPTAVDQSKLSKNR